MKQEPSLRSNPEDTGQEEVFRCTNCGAIIGYYGPGSTATTRCPTCREDVRLEFREGCLTLKRVSRRAKLKPAT